MCIGCEEVRDVAGQLHNRRGHTGYRRQQANKNRNAQYDEDQRHNRMAPGIEDELAIEEAKCHGNPKNKQPKARPTFGKA